MKRQRKGFPELASTLILLPRLHATMMAYLEMRNPVVTPYGVQGAISNMISW